MKAQEIIDVLNQDRSWVNFDQTRDVVLFGDPQQEISNVGVCWVATMSVIQTAIDLGINFIISHENCFYEESTAQRKAIREARFLKMELLKQHGICVYRCHDVWDKMPEYGVSDAWSNIIDLPFEPRNVASFNSFAHFEPLSAQQIASKIANGIQPFGQDSVTLLGNPDQMVTSLAIGTGAATDVFSMIKEGAECVVVSDDGKNNWVAGQYCVDFKIPMIIVHHPSCENPGIMKMAEYLKSKFPQIQTNYIDSGFEFHTIVSTNNLQ